MLTICKNDGKIEGDILVYYTHLYELFYLPVSPTKATRTERHVNHIQTWEVQNSDL